MASWGHQKQAYWFGKDLNAVGFFMDMGCGKTKPAVDLVLNRGHARTLVITVKAAMDEGVWPNWFNNCALEPDKLKVIQLTNKYTMKQRAQIVIDEIRVQISADNSYQLVFIINYEVIWREPLATVFLKAGFDCVIADEGHKLKSAGSRVSKYADRLGRRVPYRVATTGTPAPENPLDVYGLYRFLDPGIFGTNYKNFEKRYAIFDQYQPYKVEKWINQEELNEKMYNIAFRVTDDILDLPEPVNLYKHFNLAPEAARIYKTLNKDLVVNIGDSKVKTNTVLTKGLRLQQIVNGYVPLLNGKMKYMDSGKTDLLSSIVDNINKEEPLIIACEFHPDIDKVKSIIRSKGRSVGELSGRKSNLKEWQGGKYNTLVVQIQSGNAAIDFTRGKYCIFYSLGLSLGNYRQFRKRGHRPGQTRNMIFIHLLARNTIDIRTMRAMEAKQNVVSYIENEIKMGVPAIEFVPEHKE